VGGGGLPRAAGRVRAAQGGQELLLCLVQALEPDLDLGIGDAVGRGGDAERRAVGGEHPESVALSGDRRPGQAVVFECASVGESASWLDGARSAASSNASSAASARPIRFRNLPYQRYALGSSRVQPVCRWIASIAAVYAHSARSPSPSSS